MGNLRARRRTHLIITVWIQQRRLIDTTTDTIEASATRYTWYRLPDYAERITTPTRILAAIGYSDEVKISTPKGVAWQALHDHDKAILWPESFLRCPYTGLPRYLVSAETAYQLATRGEAFALHQPPAPKSKPAAEPGPADPPPTARPTPTPGMLF